MTIGNDFYAKLIEVHGRRIKLVLWDSPGAKRYRATLSAYCSNTVGGLLVFDVTRRESFVNLSMLLEVARRYVYAGLSFFILVGNKTDLPKQREVSKEEALSFATENGMEYYETSAMNGSNITEVFHKLAEKILTLVDSGLIRIEEGWKGIVKGEC